MQFGVLGPLVIRDGDQELHVGSRTQSLIMTALLASRDKAVSSDVLIDAIWDEAPPASAAASLRTYVSRLRQTVGDRIERQGAGYALKLFDEDSVDAHEFEFHLAESARDPQNAAVALELGLQLWRGDAYSDFSELELVRPEAARLDQLRQSGQESFARSLLESRDSARAVAEAEALVLLHPFREGGWIVLVDALAAENRVADALRAFQRASDTLAEAGLQPSGALQAAESRALAQEPPAVESGTSAQPAEPIGGQPDIAARAPFPAPTASLIGRDDDLDQVDRLLDNARVVTVPGPGGVGKTRLALEVLLGRQDKHRLGVRFVPLARVSEGEAVGPAIADALDVSGNGDVTDVLFRVGDLDVVVLLDNCEHVVEAVSEAIELILAGGGAARVLTTSRERIGVAGEHSWSLAPLDALGTHSPAVDLFIERAASLQPTASFDDRDRELIKSVCEDLDGLPLAIEMAAARSASLGIGELAAAIRDRVDVLKSSRRQGDPRHRTLTDVIEWSEALLSEDEREVFHDISVFSGPVSSSDVQAVVQRSDLLPVLGDLADRSLIVTDTSGPATKYRMLGTLRRHGRARLEEEGRFGELSLRHAEHYLNRARQADADLRGLGEADASAALSDMFDELRVAHQFCRVHAPELAVGLSAALHVYAVSRTRDEMQQWAIDASDLAAAPVDAAQAFATVAYRANNRGLFVEARDAAERALELAQGDPVSRFAREVLSDIGMYNGDLTMAYDEAKLGLAAAHAVDDSRGVALGAAGMAMSLRYGGQVDEAMAVLDDIDYVGFSPSGLGWLDYVRGEVLSDVEPLMAVDHYTRAIEAADLVGERFLGGVARVSLVSVLSRHGEPRSALDAFAAVIDHWYRRGHETHQLTTLRNLVTLFDRLEFYSDSAELFGSVVDAEGAPTFGEEQERLEQAAERSRRVLGSEFGARVELGSSRSVAQAALHSIDVVNRRIEEGPPGRDG
ncbi:MAG: BTAD domain-containing putative transcriptional regulator [Acidimicrobiales bacterium]